MPVSMRGSAFVSFKHETKEEFEQRRELEKEFIFTNEYHDKLVTRGLSDRCAELELERRRHLNFSSPMSHRSTPESSPAGRGSRRPSYETTSPIVHCHRPSPCALTKRLIPAPFVRDNFAIRHSPSALIKRLIVFNERLIDSFDQLIDPCEHLPKGSSRMERSGSLNPGIRFKCLCSRRAR